MSITAETSAAAKTKLPLWNTIGLSYSTYFKYFDDVLQISWLWILVLAPLNALTGWYQMSWAADFVKTLPATKDAVKAMHLPLQFAAIGYLLHAVLFVAGVSIAVAWHRRLLLNDLPKMSGSNVMTRQVWQYIGIGLLICLIVALPALVITAPFAFLVMPQLGEGSGGFLTSMGTLALYLFGFVVVFRLCMLLPARAVGDQTLTLKQSWRRTKGNTWRMFWGVFVCTVPPLFSVELLLLWMIGLPTPDTIARGENAGEITILNAVFIAYYLLTLPIFVGFLSHAYQHFFLKDAKIPSVNHAAPYDGTPI
jgi:hypothetical protein